MKNIVFLCHGNICRSPAAEIICNHLLKEKGLDKEYRASSYALTREEIGNNIYPPMRKALKEAHLEPYDHYAELFNDEAYKSAYMAFYMDNENAWLVRYRCSDPRDIIKPISIYTPSIDEIDDPWYSGEYKKVVQELQVCIRDIVERL